MKRLLATSLILGASFAFTVTAHAHHHRRGCPRMYDLGPSKRMARRIYHGTRTVTLRQLRAMGHREGCQRVPGDGRRLRRYDRHLGREHRRRVASSSLSSGDLASVPGVPRAFAACVAFRESTDGKLSSNIYGIIPASGYDVAGMSVAQQKRVFSELYRKDGTAPWRPYDGC